MRDSEKPLKVISGIVSGILVVSALLFFISASDKPKAAEAALAYSAPPDFDPTLLTHELYKLRKDQDFLVEVALRSKFAKSSTPELAQVATKLGSRLTFGANWQEHTVSIRFNHRKTTTAMDVANTAAEVAKERLEDQQRKLAMELIAQADVAEDKRKLREQTLRREADAAAGLRNEEDEWRCRIRPMSLMEVETEFERNLRKLEELKTKPVFSIGSIRPAKVISE